MSNELGPVLNRNAVVELRVQISPVGLLSIAAIVLAGAVVTGSRSGKRGGRSFLAPDSERRTALQIGSRVVAFTSSSTA